MEQSIMDRLRGLLQSRYGKALEVTPLMAADRLDGTSLSRRGDLRFPMHREQVFLGTAVVRDGFDLSEDQRREIRDLLQLILEPALYRHHLDLREGLLLSGSWNEHSSDRPNSVGARAVRIISASPDRIRKAAQAIHDLSGRWAFAPFRQIGGIPLTVGDFHRLGYMTLFIDDFDNLSQEERQAIDAYVLSEPRSDIPLIVVGSHPSQSSEWTAPWVTIDLDRIPRFEHSVNAVLEMTLAQDPS